jgi:Tfp pilus assembly protein PilN
MINLLPPEIKSDIVYARRNAILLKWLLVIILVLAGVILTVIAGQIFINQSKKNQTSQIEAGKTVLKKEELAKTQEQIKTLSDSIKLANDVLSKQIAFSKVLTRIGEVVPQGSVLTGLSINKLEGGIDLTAATKDYNTATQVQLNLQDPRNQIFEKADIIRIQCAENGSATNVLRSLYPCDTTIRALFANNDNFLYINKDRDNE